MKPFKSFVYLFFVIVSSMFVFGCNQQPEPAKNETTSYNHAIIDPTVQAYISSEQEKTKKINETTSYNHAIIDPTVQAYISSEQEKTKKINETTSYNHAIIDPTVQAYISSEQEKINKNFQPASFDNFSTTLKISNYIGTTEILITNENKIQKAMLENGDEKYIFGVSVKGISHSYYQSGIELNFEVQIISKKSSSPYNLTENFSPLILVNNEVIKKSISKNILGNMNGYVRKAYYSTSFSVSADWIKRRSENNLDS